MTPWSRLAVVALLSAGCGRIGFGDNRAGTGDGAPGDTPGDGAPACLPSYELCDGFETSSLASVWTPAPGVSIDGTVAHRGHASLHAVTPALAPGTNAYSIVAQRTTLPLGDPTFYVRVWVLLSHLPVNNMELITAEPLSGPAKEDALFVESGGLSVYTQYDDRSMETAAPPPVGTWFCVVWTVKRDTGGAGALTMAGAFPSVTLPNVQTDGNSPITEMDLGAGFSGTNVSSPEPAMDLWIDDVIVAASPMTCDD